jgi:hypothetical protein
VQIHTTVVTQALPRPEDLVAGLAMAEHEGAVYEDSMVRQKLRCQSLDRCTWTWQRWQSAQTIVVSAG